MGLGDASYYPKIAAGIVAISMLLFLISYGAPNWSKTDENLQVRREHIGLWKYCTYPKFGTERCDDFINVVTSDWLKAAQSFMTIGMFGLMACCGLVILYAFIMPESMGAALGAIITLGTTGVLLMIGVGVWAGKFQDYFMSKDLGAGAVPGVLDWAFGVACASCVGVFISMSLVLFDLILQQQEM